MFASCLVRITRNNPAPNLVRFRDHLDDMPAHGYALSSLTLDRIPSFLSLLFGHIANYHSRGTYNSPEQVPHCHHAYQPTKTVNSQQPIFQLMSHTSTHVQLSLYGDGVPGTDASKHPWTFSDSVRGMLAAGAYIMLMRVALVSIHGTRCMYCIIIAS